MFDKILGLIIICIVLNACVETRKNIVVVVQPETFVKQEEKSVEKVLPVKVEKMDNMVTEVVIQTTPKQYIMDCMVYLKASEEECKNNWSKVE